MAPLEELDEEAEDVVAPLEEVWLETGASEETWLSEDLLEEETPPPLAHEAKSNEAIRGNSFLKRVLIGVGSSFRLSFDDDGFSGFLSFIEQFVALGNAIQEACVIGETNLLESGGEVDAFSIFGNLGELFFEAGDLLLEGGAIGFGQDKEFVSAIAVDGVFAKPIHQREGEALQQAIALFVAIGVIPMLEIVDVDDHQ